MTDPRWIGAALCEAWGLDPRDVLGVVIRFEPCEMPVATVRVLLNEKVIRHVLELVPRDGTPSR